MTTTNSGEILSMVEAYVAARGAGFGFDVGSKWIRVWKTLGTSSRSAHVFVCRKTGNVYNAASWKRAGAFSCTLATALVEATRAPMPAWARH